MKKYISKHTIPLPLYKKITSLIPIVYVDLVIVYNGKFLLTRRKNKPARGHWWLIGGRIFHGEKIETAVKRKVREEATIKNVESMIFLGFDQLFFKNGRFGEPMHAVSLLFLVHVASENREAFGSDGELGWFSKINKRWPSYVRKWLKNADIKS